MTKRGDQNEYNKLLDAFNAKTKSKSKSVLYLMTLGFSHGQANNAVHVYFKGGGTHASSKLTQEIRDELLNNFNAMNKTHNENVKFLMSRGYTYHQANSASYQYRQERGLIGK